MQKIQDIQITNKIIQQSAESQPTQSEDSQKSIVWLWSMMTSMYGHKWTSSHGAEIDAGRVWEACLKGISHEQIKLGFNKIIAEKGKWGWPPSSTEFLELCDESEPVQLAQHRAIEKADLIAKENRLTHGTQADRNKAARPFIDKMKEGLK